MNEFRHLPKMYVTVYQMCPLSTIIITLIIIHKTFITCIHLLHIQAAKNYVRQHFQKELR